jgi:transposase
MSVTATRVQLITGGVDTHQRTHHAGIVDEQLRPVADREFPVTEAGYRALLEWMAGFGLLTRVGVESTGSYGAGLTRFLVAAGVEVREVQGPEKTTRVHHGKSDVIDAYAAARQAAAGVGRSGRALGIAKDKTGIVEAIRAVKVPRDGAVKDRTRAYSQLRDLVTTAPAAIHDELIGLTGTQRANRAAGYRPDPARLAEPTQAVKYALRDLARHIHDLDTRIAAADKVLAGLTRQAVPSLLALRQVGVQTAAQLVITVGQNIDRIRSEASFAKLIGVAPLEASSGKTGVRHRLNRGGDRQANSAVYLVVVGRMKDHPPTQHYLTRRLAEGKTTNEIIRCLKRLLARTLYRNLRHDLLTPVPAGAHPHRPQPGSGLAAGHPQGPGLDPGEDGATLPSRDHPSPLDDL